MHVHTDLAGRLLVERRFQFRRRHAELLVEFLRDQLLEQRQRELLVEQLHREQQLLVQHVVVEHLVVQHLVVVEQLLVEHGLVELELQQPVLELVEFLGLVELGVDERAVVAALSAYPRTPAARTPRRRERPVYSTGVSHSDPDVVVIGAGVVGGAIAFELASAGHRVRVLDMRRPGDGASQASAGILAPWVEGHHSAALRTLGLRSLDAYEAYVRRVVERSGIGVEFRAAGTLEIAVNGADVARLQQSAASLAAAGVAAEWMDGGRARALEPVLGSHVVGALKIPSHAIVNVPALTAASAAAAAAAGASFQSGLTVTALERDADRVLVRTTQGELRVAHVVLAAGSWSAALAPDGAVAPPVRPVRGQLLHVKTAPGVVGHVLWGADVYLVPWADGTIYVGATSEEVGFDERPTAGGVGGLLARTVALAPGLADATFVEARAGLRPGTDDSLPFIGPSDVLPGLVYACGHFRNGALLAPLTAALVAGLLGGSTADPALPLLAPSRAGRL